MNTIERLKQVEATLAELNIRLIGSGSGGGNHNLLSATHPDTDPDSPVRGDILRGIAGPEWQRYAIGAAGRYLRSDGNDPSWQALQAGDLPVHAAEHEVGGGDLVNHDALTNFVANEHIDHTAVTLTAGEGLSGGGTIAANRTFDLDINGLVEDAAVASGDFFVYYDTVAGDHKKLDFDDLPGGADVKVAVDNVAAADFLGAAFNDGALRTGTPLTYADGGNFVTLSFAHLGFESLADPDADRIVFWDESAPNALKWLTSTEGIQISALNLLLDIDGLVEDAAGTSGDFFVYYDTVAGDHKKIDWDDMPGGGGASPWTVNGVDIWWNGGGSATIGTNAKSSLMTEGLTIFQGGSDNEILALQSSDVNHGITTYADTDTFGSIRKIGAYNAGVKFEGFSVADEAFRFGGTVTTCNTAKALNADCIFEFVGYKKSGTGRVALDDATNIFGVYAGSANACIFIVDENGRVYMGFGKEAILFISESVNTKQTRGITINMIGSAPTSESIALKDANYISHTATVFTENDTWAINKIYNNNGGLALTGITETQVGIAVQGLATSDNTTKSSAGLAPIILNAGKIVSNDFGAVGADGNLVAIQNDGSSRWIVDEDGDVWQNGVLHIPNMKSGANQGAAGAVAGELWHDTNNDTVKMGV